MLTKTKRSLKQVSPSPDGINTVHGIQQGLGTMPEKCERFRKSSWLGTARSSFRVLLVALSVPHPPKALTSFMP